MSIRTNFVVVAFRVRVAAFDFKEHSETFKYSLLKTWVWPFSKVWIRAMPVYHFAHC